jgi:acyl-coenzyme A thioesterase PaaI-like protein
MNGTMLVKETFLCQYNLIPIVGFPMTFKQKIKSAKPVIVHGSTASFVSGGLINDFIDIKYFFDEDSGCFYASVTFGEIAKGPPMHAHGGATAAVLDEVMGATAWMNRLHSMTAQLKINYLKAIPLNKEVYIETRIEKVAGKKVTIKGRIFDEDETNFVETESLFIKQGKEKFQKMGAMPDELFTYGVAYKK